MKSTKKDLVVGGVLAIVTIISVLANTLWRGTRENPFNYTFGMIGKRFDHMSDFLFGVLQPVFC